MTPILQVCLNGPRDRAECPELPFSPQELADAAREAVAEGAQEVHLHPKDPDGADTLAPEYVDAAVAAVREAVPDVPISVSTGARAQPDPERRTELVRGWTVLPDRASVNWHENGAASVARALLDHGIGVEAAIRAGTDAAAHFLSWPERAHTVRLSAEVPDNDPRDAPETAMGLLAELTRRTTTPILLHGREAGAWPVFHTAATQHLDTRIGLEDVLHLPDGSAASGNAALVRTARMMLGVPER